MPGRLVVVVVVVPCGSFDCVIAYILTAINNQRIEIEYQKTRGASTGGLCD